MIYHPIRKLTEVDIREILIVTGTEHMGDVVTLLGSAKDFECRFTYKVQDEAGGIAQALGLSENFTGGEPMAVILADNIIEASLEKAISSYPGERGLMLVTQVPSHKRY